MKQLSRVSLLSLMSAFALAGCATSYQFWNTSKDLSSLSIAGPAAVPQNAPTNYSFTAESDEDYMLSYNVNWGDGAESAVPNVRSGVAVTGNHAWAQDGHYTVTAKVTDGHGQSSQATYDIDVGTPAAKMAHPQETNVNRQPNSNNDLPQAYINHSTVAPRGVH